MGTSKGFVLGLLLSATALTGRSHAEPSYLVYPGSPAVFRYDATRYEVVAPGNPKFDPAFAIGGGMLWDRVEQRIPVEFYRAPLITGFEASPTGMNEFVTVGNDFDVIVDGFGTMPRTLGSLCLRFWPEPPAAFVQLFLDGVPVTSLTASLTAVEVTTALGNGFYSDTGVHRLSWVGAAAIEILAFSDKNANRAFDGRPLYRIVARDTAVGVESTTWGRVKALYRN
jgi:hypothetical protein